MTYYQEITLLPDAEVSLYFLWSKVFAQVHLALAAYKNENGVNTIGIAIPGYSEKGLGSKLRLMASEEALQALDIENRFQRLADYVHCTKVRPILQRRIRGYSVYSRYQPDEPVERKARRFIRRHEGISYEEALGRLKARKETYRLPYITLRSGSSQQHFHLFIQKKTVDTPVAGTFSTYGLSPKTTVPEF